MDSPHEGSRRTIRLQIRIASDCPRRRPPKRVGSVSLPNQPPRFFSLTMNFWLFDAVVKVLGHHGKEIIIALVGGDQSA